MLSPAVDQNGFAAHVYEEVAATPHVQVQFGGRVENSRFRPEADQPDRDFTNFSGSVGLLLMPNAATTLAFSVARAARNHLNYLKDLAPEMGRSFRIVYNVKF